jgi:hypothetical protein
VDLLLPRTDELVAIQAVVALAVWSAAFRWSRRDREVRLLVVGAGLLTLAFFGVRALH